VRRNHQGPGLAQRPRRALATALLLACGCSKSAGSGPKLRGPDEYAERTTGCIDTPIISPEHRPTTGVQCGREASPIEAWLRGRVVADAGGLPGVGLEAMTVSVHATSGALQLDRLPPAHAETETGPQGAFAISLPNVGECLIVVRAEPGGPVLAAQRIQITDAARVPELVLLVPRPD
jgi:hypothetical protein